MNKLITQLGYAGFEVSDLPRWERFASDVLGLGVTAGPRPDTRLLRMDANRYRFILTEGPADDLSFAGWQTANAQSVEAFGKHLDAKGVAWSWATDDELALRAVQRMLHFKDPVGNRHEVYCGPPLASDRFASPKVASGFVTGAEGLGHLVYSSTDYARSVQFAQEVLGLGLSDKIALEVGPGMRFEVAFMHANSRHHSYAVAPQPPIPGPHKRLHHFMLEVNTMDEVGFARDRCLDMSQGVLMDIGQHPNDKMISFYGQTPSGFHVEFGWGGAKIDESNWQVVTYDKLSEWGHRPSTEVALQAPGPVVAAAGTEPKVVSAGGQWNVTIKTPMGENKVVFDLQVEGNQLHGSIKSPKETSEIFEGSAKGNQLSWKAKVSTPISMKLQFTATVDGNSISGGAKSAFGTAPFSGTRA